MNEKDALREAMKNAGWNMETLAKNTGHDTSSAVSNRLKGKKSMRVDTFVRFLSAMGYSVKVSGHGKEWIIGDEERNIAEEAYRLIYGGTPKDGDPK